MDKNRKILILLFWILFWQILSFLAKNPLLFPGIVEILRAFFGIFAKAEEVIFIGNTSLHILGGYIFAFLMGFGLGFLGYFYPLVGEILHFPLTFLKSVPVVSLVFLVLLYTGTESLPFFVVMSIVLPQIYNAVREGLSYTNKSHLELAQIYPMRAWDKFWHIYFYELMGYLKISAQVSMAYAWKAGVAAEVLAMTKNSIGEGMYLSKIYLNTATLFAWTVIVLILAKAFEYLLGKVFEWVMVWNV